VLEALDEVPWADLAHAYGPASDVPDLLRALASADGEVHKRALLSLYSTVFHQGTRYEASSYAVPFLVELATEASVPARDKIVELLVHLAVGYQEPWYRSGYQPELVREEKELLDAEWGEWKIDAVDVYEAVLAQAATLAAMAESDLDAKVRDVATYALAFLPDAADVSLPVLHRLISSGQDATSLANALLAYGLLGARREQGLHLAEPLLATLAKDPRPLVCYAAASSLARVSAARGQLDPAAVDVLLTVLAEHPGALAGTGLNWNDGDLVGLGWIALEATVPVFGTELVGRAADLLKTLDGTRAVTLTGVLLSRLFPQRAASAPQDAAQLAPEQRILLETLASEPNVWTMSAEEWGVGSGRTSFGNFDLMVTSYGLPGDAGSMRRYVNGEPLETCLPPGLRKRPQLPPS
jgi:hypothetical protein